MTAQSPAVDALPGLCTHNPEAAIAMTMTCLVSSALLDDSSNGLHVVTCSLIVIKAWAPSANAEYLTSGQKVDL